MKVVSLQLPSGPSMERLPLPFSPTELLWRYPLPWAPPPPSPLGDAKAQLPAGLPPEPRLWTREDVAVFLKWCEREFDLPNFDMDLFQMNGKALCLLTKTDLGERCPGAGDVLHNVLQMLVRDAALLGRVPSSPVTPTARAAPYPPSPHSHPPTPTWAVDGFHHFHSAAAAAAQPNSVTLSPAPSVDSSGSPQRGETMSYAPSYVPSTTSVVQNASSGSNHSDSDEEAQFTPQPRSPKEIPMTNSVSQNHQAQQHSHYRTQHREFFPSDMPESNTNGRLLWDFLQQLLNDPTQRYTNYIAWKNRETGVFKIVDPAGLAKLWGIQKNHLSMNYDKMSRALRYYYRVNILRKVQGERHCYQFLRNPIELKNIKNISLLRQQMSPTRVTPQPVVKTEMKEERCEEDPADEDMPTDLSMAAAEPWRKRARPEPVSAPPPHEKHRISALIGESMLLKRESDYTTDHYALNLKSEKCEQ
ncbi:ets DNA-binding protein pokkuri [Leguminivora glycinivorella]|uniref:ets DNA-binding protein pokkuri n=1 Tax=Leguminivora glycinivorella TaxID=1035111 RepID=UPI002010494D|nr:ets DNA-binding protein pokkuri [Leguminivora glycinivorella]